MSKTTIDQVFRIDEGSVVRLETTSGDLSVIGWDKDQVSVQAPEGKASVQQASTPLEIRSVPGGSSDLQVRVPHRCDLVLRAVSGDVELKDVEGQLSVQTTSGDISAHNLRGDVRVRTVSGDTDVRCSHLAGLSIDTVSGDGLIESPLDDEADYHMRSVSGDLALLVPEDQAFTVHSVSLSGEFTCNLPHEIEQQGWGKVDAQINGGGVEFHVRSASGDVRIAAAGASAEESAQGEEAAEPFASQEPEAEPFGLGETVASDEAEGALSARGQRKAILQAIEEGKMSVSEGLAKLRSLD